MKQNYTVYVSGTEASKKIAEELGFPDAKVFDPENFRKNGRIILVCGNGYEHHYSHDVSRVIPFPFSKMVIDAHHDIVGWRPVYSESESHVRHSVEFLPNLRELYMAGYKDKFNGELDKFQGEQDGKISVRHKKEIGYLKGIKEKITHPSLDLDVLQRCGFCLPEFRRENRDDTDDDYGISDSYKGPTLAEVVEVIAAVKADNDVVAFDVCGLDLETAARNRAIEQGLEAYRKIIDVFLN